MVTKEQAQRAMMDTISLSGQANQLKAQIDAMKKAFEEEMKPYVDKLQELEAQVANADTPLLAEILADIEAGNSTEADYPFVSFRHDKQVEYDKDKALAWGKENGIYVRVKAELDASSLRKDALAGKVDEVTAQEIGLTVSARLSAIAFKNLFT